MSQDVDFRLLGPLPRVCHPPRTSLTQCLGDDHHDWGHMPVRASVPVAVAIAGLILIATTMRGPFTAVGPLLDTIRSDLHLSGAGAGALGMLPLLAFAGISPVAPVIARRIGLERSLVVALAVHTAGLVLRALPGVVALFAGTALIGVAIGTVNVLLLALIKRDNPA